ncbi:hypothetical protein ACFW0H_25930 [Pseudomonas sp. CR3202]|uniref:hypothetical protein n=1 Tax=Pseudomonas sp. CR3202 TaxID=3351532 RepID=UPI003BF01D9B
MARRSRSSPLEDLISLASLLPWWLSLLIAAVSWFLLHGYASSPPPTAVNPSQMASAMSGAAFRGLAMVGQYFIPFAFVCGAIGSVVGRAKRKRLIEDVARR